MSCLDCQYENTRRVTYGDAVFVPVCMKCHRFVRPDQIVVIGEDSGLSPAPNATCKKCGRTHMHFEGFFEYTGEVS